MKLTDPEFPRCVDSAATELETVTRAMNAGRRPSTNARVGALPYVAHARFVAAGQWQSRLAD